MTRDESPAEQLRNALTLLGPVPRKLAGLSPTVRADIEALLEAASKRIWKALYQLEPRRAKLAKRAAAP